MKNEMPQNRDVNGENGIALIFTLGILALLLVMALAFASNSLLEAKIAENYNREVSARIIAQTAMNRAIMINKAGLGDQLDTRWNYIREGDDPDPDKNRIIARFQYVPRVSGCKLPIDYIVQTGRNEVEETSGVYVPKERPGVGVDEIHLVNVTDFDPIPNKGAAFPNNIDPAAFGNFTDLMIALGFPDDGTHEVKREYFTETLSFSTSKEAFWVNEGGDRADEIYHRFNLRRGNNWWKEAALAFMDDDLLDVFLLADNIAWDDSISDGGGLPWIRDAFKNDSLVYDNSLMNPPSPVDPDAALSTFTTAEALANQITANIISYNQPEDAAPVTDYTDAAPFATTYFGLKRAPYINEIGFWLKSTGVVDSSEPSGDPAEYTHEMIYTFDGAIPIEIINIYDYDFDNVYTVTIVEGELSFEFKYLDDENASVAWQPVSLDLKDEVVNIVIGNNGYAVGDITLTIPDTNLTSSYTDTNDSCPFPEIKNLKMNIKGLKGEYEYTTGSPTHVNFTKFENSYKPSDFTLDDDKKQYLAAFYAEVEDPRQNLNQGDWEIDDIFTDDGDGGKGTFLTNPSDEDIADLHTMTAGSQRNRNSDPSAGDDPETATDPARVAGAGGVRRISTAYIRHAPMKSPWELGAIHRGVKWQTINLRKFQDNGNKARMCQYKHGDANILDQVKMGDIHSTGKVNINVNDPTIGTRGALKALFQDIYLGNNYEVPGAATGHRITEDEASNIAEEILKIGNINDYRLSLVDILYEPDGSDPPIISSTFPSLPETTAVLEALIGKTVNLLSAEPVVMEGAVVIVETITDVDTDGKEIQRRVFNEVTKKWETKEGKSETGEFVEYIDLITSQIKVSIDLEDGKVTNYVFE